MNLQNQMDEERKEKDILIEKVTYQEEEIKILEENVKKIENIVSEEKI